MTTEGVRDVALEDEDHSALAELILCGWPSTKAEVQKELKPCRSFKDEIAIIDRTAIKGRV